MDEKPIVTIGLPIFNGENYLENAIESILRQTYKNYQLIISDNASTDGTQQLCERYAAEHENVSYYRTERNHGAAWNFKRTFELSSTPYFKWMAHDDIVAPDYLEKCIGALEKNPEAVLAYPLTNIIDNAGQIIERYSFHTTLPSLRAHERFRDLLFGSNQCYEVFGVIRSEYLAQTDIMGDYGHADGVLLSHLSLLGRFHQVPEYLFFSRRHANQSIKMHVTDENKYGRPDYHAYTVWFNPSKKDKIIFPNWRILFENINVIRRSGITLSEAVRCYYYVLKWIKRYRIYLIGDLSKAAKQLFARYFQ